ncbi:MAG: NUDIX domain-containing protein [Acetobacteraceae bacterium]
MRTSTDMSGFLRHIRACRDARLPGGRVRLWIGDDAVGWVGTAAAACLREFPAITSGPDGLRLIDAPALGPIARTLAERGLSRWRGEAFDVRARADGPVLARVDRGALPVLGVAATGVHVNGLAEREDGTHLWIARRAADKALDPGKLDHIVAGGVPAGLTPAQTLVKEAAEEAAIPAALARQAVPVATIAYAMERPEGLRRDYLLCYDLRLPPEFRPHATDGEVESFELWPILRVLEAVRDTDDFKFNVNLVLIDLFLRRHLIAGPEGAALREALDSD